MGVFIYTHNKYTQNKHVMQTKTFILDAINCLTGLMCVRRESVWKLTVSEVRREYYCIYWFSVSGMIL